MPSKPCESYKIRSDACIYENLIATQRIRRAKLILWRLLESFICPIKRYHSLNVLKWWERVTVYLAIRLWDGPLYSEG